MSPNGGMRRQASRVILAAGAAVAIAAAIVTGYSVSAVIQQRAAAALAASEREAHASEVALDAALGERAEARREAVDAVIAAAELAGAVRVEYMADPGLLPPLDDAQRAVQEAAGMIGEGTSVTLVVESVRAERDAGSARSVAEMETRAAANRDYAASIAADVTDVLAATDRIGRLVERLHDRGADILRSASRFAEAEHDIDQATPAARDALQTAVAGLQADGPRAHERLRAFNSAFEAAVASHAEQVALEAQRAADAQRQAEAARSVTPAEPKPRFVLGDPLEGYDTTPPTFEMGPGFVSWHPDCVLQIDEWVGHGKHSTWSASLIARGVNWSASVVGATVRYWVCP